jgi:glycosyltransferase involved in cell wall biosynthesis
MNTNQNDVSCLNPQYSTTRIVTTERPKIGNDSSSKFQTELFLPAQPQRQGEGGLRTKGYFKKSFQDKPLVSIITVVFNGRESIEQTLRSVLEQSYDNVEYIVIDGGSTDGTKEIIRKHEQALDYWVSEPDSGIAEAWNKGIQASTGDIVGIINGGDWYELNAAADVAELFLQNKAAGVIHGNRRQWNESGTRVLGISRPATRVEITTLRLPINHPTCFVRRQTYQTYGLFDMSYRVAMDYDFVSRLCKQKVGFLYLDAVIANMRTGGISSGFTGIKEGREFLIRNGSKISKAYSLYYIEAFKTCFVLIADALKIKGILRYCYWKLAGR